MFFLSSNKKYILSFLFFFFLFSGKVNAQDINGLLLPEEYSLSDNENVPKDRQEKVLSFLLEKKRCTIEGNSSLLCSLRSRDNGSGVFVYAGVLNPGNVAQTGSAGFVFRW